MRQTQSIKHVFSKFSVLTWLLALGVVWLVVAVILWWQIVYTDPKHVFEGMLKNNFSTTAFTRQTDSDQDGLQAKEITQVQLGPNAMTQALTTLTQQEDKVVTESISTPDKEYVRYKQIETKSTGEDVIYDNALNKWASNPSNGTSQSVAQAMLGIFPMGNVPAEERRELMEMIQKDAVFVTDYGKAKKDTKNGRSVYVYDIQLMPQPYIAMLKKYGESVGLSGQVTNLNPNDYADAAPTRLKVTVDIVSRHMVSVAYAENAERAETFSGYGIHKDIYLPTNTISTSKLQQLLAPPQ